MVHGSASEEARIVAVNPKTSRPRLVRVVTKTPSKCLKSELAAFERLVLLGGEVEKHGLTDRIRKAEVLAFAYVSGVIAGIAGLKRPDSGYRASMFRKSGIEGSPTDFPLELGWLYVRDEQRGKGLSVKLAKWLLRKCRGTAIFATSRSDNIPMHRGLARAGFVQAGRAFASRRGSYFLQAFVRVAAQSHS